MSSDLTTPDGARAAVTAAAQAAAATLPLPATVEGPWDDPTPGQLLPPDGMGRAVSLEVRGAATGALVLIVADGLAAALEDSPFGTKPLLEALSPALADAGSALTAASAAPVQVATPVEVPSSTALAGIGDGRVFCAVPLMTGGEHVATLALVLAPAAATAGAELPVPPQREATEARTHEFQALQELSGGGGTARPLDLLHDVQMGVTAELGRTRMTVRDLLSLTPGSVVELDRAAGSPVDVLVNGTLIARGEVVVIDEEYGIRISEIVGTRAVESAARR